MTQNVERVDLAAQEPTSETCPQCLNLVTRPYRECHETGCPMADADVHTGGDFQVGPELARANLQRMRGDYDGATGTCLSILKRLPGSFAAHSLLGDIYSERGDLEHASEWYELAIDLHPEDQPVREKLESIKTRIKQRHSASTSAQLGIAAPEPRVRALTWAAVVFTALVAVLAFIAGRMFKSSKVGDYTTPIAITQSASQPADEASEPPKTAAPLETPAMNKPADVPRDEILTRPLASPKPEVDLAILEKVREQLVESKRVIDAQREVRSLAIMITATASATEDLKSLCARMAADALDIVDDAPRVTMRLVSGPKMLFVADMAREDLKQLRETVNRPSDSDLVSILRNVWPVPDAAANG